MVTPTSDEIRGKATALFMGEQHQAGLRDSNTPEDHELKEGGYWMRARNQLMRGPDSRKIEKMFQKTHQPPFRKPLLLTDLPLATAFALKKLEKRAMEDLCLALECEKWGQAIQQVHNLRSIYTLEWQMEKRNGT